MVATIPGEIVERKINKGQVVQPADALFTVADLSTLWAIAEVPESNSYLIRKGQKASLIIPALRNQQIEGTVAHVDSIVNPQTRTVVVRMELSNKDGQEIAIEGAYHLNTERKRQLSGGS